MSIFEDDSEEKLIICEDNKAYRLIPDIKGRLLSKEAITTAYSFEEVESLTVNLEDCC